VGHTPLIASLATISHGRWQCDSADAIAPRVHVVLVDYFGQVIDTLLPDWPLNCRPGDLIARWDGVAALARPVFPQLRLHRLRSVCLAAVVPAQLFIHCSDVERTFQCRRLPAALLSQPIAQRVIDIVTDTDEAASLLFHRLWCPDGAAFLNATSSRHLPPIWASQRRPTPTSRTSATSPQSTTAPEPHPRERDRSPQGDVLAALGNLTIDSLESNKTVLGSDIVRELLRIPKVISAGKSQAMFALESSSTAAVTIGMVFLTDRVRFTAPPQLAAYLTYELWKDNTDRDHTIGLAVNGIKIPLRQNGRRRVSRFRSSSQRPPTWTGTACIFSELELKAQ
jgi:hypothetical protein